VVSVARIRCKLWSCDTCSTLNRKQWRAVLYRRLPEISSSWSFHTFTTGSHDEQTIEEAYSVITKNWERLIKRLKREYGKFSYVRTIELHKSEYPHVHALFSIFLPDCEMVVRKNGETYWHSPTIDKHLSACDFGIIASSENLAVDTDGGLFKALGYATKYMTKRDDKWIKRPIRAIQTSRDIKLKNLEKSSFSWQIKSGIYENEVLKERHYDITTDKKITADDFEDSFIYPPELKDN
jgi:hypothetical protein